MSMRHSTTKRKRRPKSSKRVDWTAETLRKLKEHEQAEVITGTIDMTAVERRVLADLTDDSCLFSCALNFDVKEDTNGN